MAIGVTTDSDFQKELDRFKKSETTGEVKDLPSKGRPSGSQNIPEPIKKTLAETALVEGNKAAHELAEQLNVGKQNAHAYKNDATSLSNYNESNQELAVHNRGVKELITKTARQTLLSALQSITSEKLQDVSPRVAAGIAKDMSSVVKNIEPEEKDESPVQFVILAPQQKQEKQYEVIEVND